MRCLGVSGNFEGEHHTNLTLFVRVPNHDRDTNRPKNKQKGRLQLNSPISIQRSSVLGRLRGIRLGQ